MYLLSRQLSEVRTRANDVANWPNPFQGLADQTFQDTDATWIELIDGSSNSENIPYGPLLVNARKLDVLVTLEGSADDVNNWPKYVMLFKVLLKYWTQITGCTYSGSSLIATSLRQSKFLQASHQKFPPIPSTPEGFISEGLNLRPTFFGCDPPNPPDYPMVIYLPNAPPFTGADPVAK